MKLPIRLRAWYDARFNPTELAKAQDAILEKGGTGTRVYLAAENIERLERYNLLLRFFLPKGNLYIRQKVILAALYEYRMKPKRGRYLLNEGIAALKAYTDPSGIYAEGRSYFLYCLAAFQFYGRLPDGLEDYFRRARACFSELAAPDGRVPTTDTRALDTLAAPRTVPAFASLTGYTVVRRSETYLFINHDERVSRLRRNFHVQGFGSFCAHKSGAWVVPTTWYEGYKAKRQTGGGEPWAQNVIVGLFNRGLWWRFGPFAPRLRVVSQSSTTLVLRMGSARRTFFFYDDHVEVNDEGGSFSAIRGDYDHRELQVSSEHRRRVGDHVRFYGKTRRFILEWN